MRRDARKDANQTEIVEVLRSVGATVAITSMIGKGFPDLVVGFRNKNFLFEVKDGAKPPSARKLTRDEHEFHQLWRGGINIVNSAGEALEVLGVEYYG